MKVLLDEQLPHGFRHSFPGHEVYTVAYQGWAGFMNGRLLDPAAAARFDALITIDASIEYQQNLTSLPLAVVVLDVRSNVIDDLLPLVPQLLSALRNLKPQMLSHVGGSP